MLAGVDYVLIGAGIPRAIPDVLDRLSRGECVELPIQVVGAVPGETALLRFDPEMVGLGPPPALKRPKFLAIVASVAFGAAGVQIGTAFAFCAESGLRVDIKRQVFAMSRASSVDVFTDAVASPTGFPFKVLQLNESLSEELVYQSRQRICDLGYLRQAYRRENGTIGWRCPGEPVESYVK